MRLAVLMSALVMSIVVALGREREIPNLPAFTTAELADFVRQAQPEVGQPLREVRHDADVIQFAALAP